VLVYAVMVDDDPRAVELFVRREDAEAFVEDVRADDRSAASCTARSSAFAVKTTLPR
jgi:hypothetical protein